MAELKIDPRFSGACLNHKRTFPVRSWSFKSKVGPVEQVVAEQNCLFRNDSPQKWIRECVDRKISAAH